MFSRNSLANKNRKKNQQRSKNHSISGYLLSSSEIVEENVSSENSLDASEFSVNPSAAKTSLNNEFDDSFDLFRAKKNASKQANSPVKLTDSSPLKKFEISEKYIVNECPSKKLCSPNEKNKNSKSKIVKKCDYFNEVSDISVPCPFCFQFQYDIYSHISTDCTPPASLSDADISKLVEMHINYWKQRRYLGVPDTIKNEDDIFKSSSSGNISQIKEESASHSSNCKIPVLKWTSKIKRKKHLLLRQTAAEREDKVTQKLAIVLMGKESTKNIEEIEQKSEPFQCAKEEVDSANLNNLLSKKLTFWEKSSLDPVKATDDTYYVKELAPFIAPIEEKIINITPSKEKDENVDAEVANILTPADASQHKMKLSETSVISIGAQLHDKTYCIDSDSCFSEHPSDYAPNHCKDLESPRNSLSGNWRKIFNTSDLSDMTVLFSDGCFLGHSLVFYAHSIKIFRSISSSSVEERGKLLDWKDIPSIPGKAYVRFIYCSDVRHFKTLNISELETVEFLCSRYEDFTLLSFIINLIDCKKNSNEDLIYQNSRNLISPDMFEDMELCNSCDTKELMDSSCLSKRKLEPTSEMAVTETYKKIKTDSSQDGNVDDCLIKFSGDQDDKAADIISISSEGTKSLNSASTMSPSRYEKLIDNPLSQCSTLPPICESPEIENKSDSPTQTFNNDSLSNKSPENINPSPKNENICSNSPRYEDKFYYDNDTFDYNNCINSSWLDDLENGDLANISATDTAGEKKQTPKPKNSLDNYFNDSIPSIFFEEVCSTPKSISKRDADNGNVCYSPICQSTPTQTVAPKNDLTTPSPQIIVSDKVTPMLNYSNLVSPELKGELEKYGLKPNMDRKKAKSLLKYIYDLIHPVVPESETNSSLTPQRNLNVQTRGSKYCMDTDTEGANGNIAEKTVETSESIIVCADEDDEGKCQFDFEICEEIPCSQNTSYLSKNDLLIKVSAFIKEDPVLFESILKYVPIWLNKFHQALKENGIKCTSNDLMDVLDELCITFRTARKPRTKNKSKR